MQERRASSPCSPSSPWLPRPPINGRVVRAIRGTRAHGSFSVGQCVSIWPNHPNYALCNVSENHKAVLWHLAMDTRHLFALALRWHLDGKVRFTPESLERLLSGGLPASGAN